MSAPQEIRQLHRQLGYASDATGPAAIPRDEIHRLLHSIKSWAALSGRKALAELCHDWESRFADSHGAESPIPADFYQAWEYMGQMLDQAGEALPAGETDNWFFLSAGLPALTEQELRLLAAVRRDGATPRWCRVWISPEETWPVTRIMVIHSRLEALGIIRAEAWLASGGESSGPFDPREWILGHKVPLNWAGRGAWYRCLYTSRGAKAAGLLSMDQVDAVVDSAYQDIPWMSSDQNSFRLDLVELDRNDVARQTLLLGNSGKPGWQLPILAAWGGRSAGDLLRKLWNSLVAQSERDLPKDCRVCWHLFDEGLHFSDHTLAVLSEIVGQWVRNSLAHASQSADKRREVFKNGALRISLALWEEAGRIVVRYEDDGPGIDVPAVEQRLALPKDSLKGDAQVLAAIEGAGVSTRAHADQLGGRGMGLNLCGQLARQVLGGALALENRPGQGLAFVLTLSPALQDLAVLVVRQGSGWLAIPQVWLGACLDLGGLTPIRDRSGAEFINRAGMNLAVLRADSSQARWGLLVRPGTSPELVIACDLIQAAETVLWEAGSSRVYSRQAGELIPLYQAL